MTLEEKTEAGYKSHAGEMGYNDGIRHKLYFDGFKDGYSAAGNVTWHDLRKNPDDLPTDKHFKITSDGDIALYDYFLGKWYDLCSDELTYHPLAWCEIPVYQFL